MLPDAPDIKVAKHLFRFIREHFAQGFSELNHTIVIDSEAVHGDVFQRAVVFDALLDAQQAFHFDVEDILRSELHYLISKRRADSTGAWSYFPSYLPLSADADILAEMIRIFVRIDSRQALEAYCVAAVRILFKDCSYPDGSFETWIIPNPPRTRVEHIQLSSAQRLWGTGPDPEVVANLTGALSIATFPWARKSVQLAGRYVAGWAEKRDFNAVWYCGEYYGAYAAARCLALVARESLRPIRDFISENQKRDGGWGATNESDVLGTSLGLLAAIHAGADTETIARGRRKLFDLAEHVGRPVDFIKINTGRVLGHDGPVLTFASAIINAAFALKALAIARIF